MSEVTRRHVAARAGNLCEYCQSPADFCPGPFAVDHIYPQSLGGPDGVDNYAWSCEGCSGAKLDAVEAPDPLTKAVFPLFHPRRQLWSEHFSWSDDLLTVQGESPTGRATVERLRLNRPPVVNLRRALQALGAHPAS